MRCPAATTAVDNRVPGVHIFVDSIVGAGLAVTCRAAPGMYTHRCQTIQWFNCSVPDAPLRILLWRDNLSIAHMNDAVAVGRRLWIVRNHQDGLAQFLV
jgi:hypothetical protein